jgi:hypothetical protein
MNATRNSIGKFNGKIVQQTLEGISGRPYENVEILCFDREKELEWNDFKYGFIGKKITSYLSCNFSSFF